jgi:hypothetical protein
MSQPSLLDWGDLLIRTACLIASGAALHDGKPEYATAFIVFATYVLLNQRLERNTR